MRRKDSSEEGEGVCKLEGSAVISDVIFGYRPSKTQCSAYPSSASFGF